MENVKAIEVNSWKGVILGLGLALITSITTWFINDQTHKAEEKKQTIERQNQDLDYSKIFIIIK